MLIIYSNGSVLCLWNSLNSGVSCVWVNYLFPTLKTQRGQDKMAAISQTTLSNAFSWMKMLELGLKFHWSLFRMVKLTIFQHLFRWWLGADQVTSRYLNQWLLRLVTHICVTPSQWVKGKMAPIYYMAFSHAFNSNTKIVYFALNFTICSWGHYSN